MGVENLSNSSNDNKNVKNIDDIFLYSLSNGQIKNLETNYLQT